MTRTLLPPLLLLFLVGITPASWAASNGPRKYYASDIVPVPDKAKGHRIGVPDIDAYRTHQAAHRLVSLSNSPSKPTHSNESEGSPASGNELDFQGSEDSSDDGESYRPNGTSNASRRYHQVLRRAKREGFDSRLRMYNPHGKLVEKEGTYQQWLDHHKDVRAKQNARCYLKRHGCGGKS